MRRGILFLLWIFILLFSVATFYVSYSAYIHEKERYIAENVSTFLISYPEKNIVALPYPELMIIKVKDEGRIYASANFASPVDLENFVNSAKKEEEKSVEVYLRRSSFDDFTFFLFANPIFLAMNLFLFVIYIAFYYLMVKELEKPAMGKARKTQWKEDEILIYLELTKHLKALKVLLHTEKLLGKEALEKAKNLVDEMLKKLENR